MQNALAKCKLLRSEEGYIDGEISSQEALAFQIFRLIFSPLDKVANNFYVHNLNIELTPVKFPDYRVEVTASLLEKSYRYGMFVGSGAGQFQ